MLPINTINVDSKQQTSSFKQGDLKQINRKSFFNQIQLILKIMSRVTNLCFYLVRDCKYYTCKERGVIF